MITRGSPILEGPTSVKSRPRRLQLQENRSAAMLTPAGSWILGEISWVCGTMAFRDWCDFDLAMEAMVHL